METEATQKALNGGPEGGEPAPKSADDANAAQAPAVTPRHTPRDRKPVNFYKPEETTRSSLKIEQVGFNSAGAWSAAVLELSSKACFPRFSGSGPWCSGGQGSAVLPLPANAFLGGCAEIRTVGRSRCSSNHRPGGAVLFTFDVMACPVLLYRVRE